ncbi:hypothetical protein [Streptomyces sp. NBC_01233]|uniref:hypothetical protein n=1 Tax=Streptomyces sp. NBC_01233 TaxID=2903787 RepID=UPI002E110CB1|nr:hypothetical protein OG332_25025 [Streptomyces sp. NBC_01233]
MDLLGRATRFAAEFGVTGGYRAPTQVEKAIIVEGVSSLFEGDVDGARTRLAEVDYKLDTFTDTPGGRRFAEVSDAAGRSGSANRGWGRVYVDLGAPPRWSVQVPHPVADQGTERLGVRVLRGAPGGVMVMAGAHRTAGAGTDPGAAGAGDDADGGGEGNPADMAHRTDSVFHAVIAELTRRGLPGIQLHGFADDSVPGTDSVVSTGAGSRAVEDAERLAEQLAGQGVEVCRAWSATCKLSGRTNEQGRLAAEHGTRFLHVELSRTVRSGSRRLDETAQAITYVTTRWSRGAP